MYGADLRGETWLRRGDLDIDDEETKFIEDDSLFGDVLDCLYADNGLV